MEVRNQYHLRNAAAILGIMGVTQLVLGLICLVQLFAMVADPAGKTKGAGFLFAEVFLPLSVLAYGLFSIPWILCARGLLRHSRPSRAGSIFLFVLFLPSAVQIVWFWWSPLWTPYIGFAAFFVSAYGLWALTSRWEIEPLERAGQKYTSLDI
jgi:hypothetical protein